MTNSQQAKSGKNQKLSFRARFISALVFVFIAAGIVILWAAANEYINLKYWLGICGFKQRTGLPCPGCGWTHAAQAFFTGHFFQAFTMQPAAVLFCIVAVLTAVFALHCAIFGINFDFLKSYLGSSSGISIVLIAAVVVILAGWAVTLIRTILENSRY
ncbi:MAG: DUF2752 domain-containing protein [Planctomycetota bacterium]|jgi:hypothetical protein